MHYCRENELENIPPLSDIVEENTYLKKTVALSKEKARTENKRYRNESVRGGILTYVTPWVTLVTLSLLT